MSPPTSFAYQWFRTASGASSVAIAGATAAAYTVASADHGCVLTCQVTATDPAGSTMVSTPGTSPVGSTLFAAVPPNVRHFAVVSATTEPEMAGLVRGVTEVVLQANWSHLQPSGAGTALNSSAVKTYLAQFAAAATAGVDVILEFAFQYAPAWVIAAVEPFTDQVGNTWVGSPSGGTYVANWFWTALGRQYTTDFMTKVTAAMGPARMAQVTHIRIGGGFVGEAHYPSSPANTGRATTAANSFFGYGTAQQTGVGLAAGLARCPLPGYVPYTGAVSHSNDKIWAAWYMTGITNWLQYVNATLTRLGWTSQRLMVLHGGFNLRTNWIVGADDYQHSVAAGEDAATVMASYQSNANMWPWCTWIDGTDPSSPTGTTDSNQAAWKKIYACAVAVGKQNYVRGENTISSSPVTVMTSTTAPYGVFQNAMAVAAPLSGYPIGVTSATWQGYKGLMWLNDVSLTGGASGVATLDQYEAAIASIYGSGGAIAPTS